MILVNPNYFDPISITEEYPETLVVEDNFYYRSILTDMIEQLKTGKGDFVLSENEEIISCQNIQIVTDLLIEQQRQDSSRLLHSIFAMIRLLKVSVKIFIISALKSVQIILFRSASKWI